MSKKKQYSESLRVGVLLALTGGFLDAYTYLCRGKVFANACQRGQSTIFGKDHVRRIVLFKNAV